MDGVQTPRTSFVAAAAARVADPGRRGTRLSARRGRAGRALSRRPPLRLRPRPTREAERSGALAPAPRSGTRTVQGRDGVTRRTPSAHRQSPESRAVRAPAPVREVRRAWRHAAPLGQQAQALATAVPRATGFASRQSRPAGQFPGLPYLWGRGVTCSRAACVPLGSGRAGRRELPPHWSGFRRLPALNTTDRSSGANLSIVTLPSSSRGNRPGRLGDWCRPRRCEQRVQTAEGRLHHLQSGSRPQGEPRQRWQQAVASHLPTHRQPRALVDRLEEPFARDEGERERQPALAAHVWDHLLPAPQRDRQSWRSYLLEAHADSILACDFFAVDVAWLRRISCSVSLSRQPTDLLEPTCPRATKNGVQTPRAECIAVATAASYVLPVASARRTSFAEHFHELVLTAAYRDAVRRAEEYETKRRRLRAQRARQEAEDLQQRLEELRTWGRVRAIESSRWQRFGFSTSWRLSKHLRRRAFARAEAKLRLPGDLVARLLRERRRRR